MSKLLALVAGMAVLLPAAASMHADEPELHPDVVYAISAVPGGIILDENTAVWPALGMELSASSPTARAVGSCATGQYCAYSGAGRTGTQLSFSVCTVVSTAALSGVGSIANARLSGTVQARSASGSVLATASAGASVNVSGTTSTLRCTL